ncbi:UDP-galactopyranose mutase [Ochrobactrum sp. MR34]|nr:UDP-galactopyranose mutase [Ochrobactrum sp. MR34]
MAKYDCIVVGSGFAGSILAERLATQNNKKVLIIEQRDHIAGNMFDYMDGNGIRIHKYGPHLFRTNSERVLNYISKFTEWQPYQHRVLASVNNELVPVPFNLTSLEKLLPHNATELKALLLSEFGMDIKVPVSTLQKHSDVRIQKLGNFIFENIYLNYTTKQWGEKPENLDFETITARVPVHISYDDRYFQESHQALPLNGYTAMFDSMLSHSNIEIRLNCKSSNVLKFEQEKDEIYFENEVFEGDVIYTGPIDELFNYCYGELPYRSLRFDLESHSNIFQPTATVNYPNDFDYTRITEYKHLMNISTPKTTIMKEYPQDYDKNDPIKNIPYYPIPKDTNTDLYNKYFNLSEKYKNLTLVGRLAEYKYYDMNNIINKALDVYSEKFHRGDL